MHNKILVKSCCVYILNAMQKNVCDLLYLLKNFINIYHMLVFFKNLNIKKLSRLKKPF